MDDNTVIDKIQEIIKNAEPATDLKEVYNYHPADLQVYPVASVAPDEWEDNYQTLRDTRRLLTVSIRIYHKLESDETKDADVQFKVRELKEKVLNILEKNVTLDGIVDWTRPTRGKYLFGKTASDVYIAEIMMQVQYRFNRT